VVAESKDIWFTTNDTKEIILHIESEQSSTNITTVFVVITYNQSSDVTIHQQQLQSKESDRATKIK
jgi:hypothetical protein